MLGLKRGTVKLVPSRTLVYIISCRQGSESYLEMSKVEPCLFSNLYIRMDS